MAETVAQLADLPSMLQPGSRVLILGGIGEAAQLAEQLVAKGHAVTTSLAGRTREPKPLAGSLRIGGFGGAAGLSAFLTENHHTVLIDATHPFARQISANARAAAALTGTRLIVFERKRWQAVDGDRWLPSPSLEAAVEAIPAGARVLLALGSQHIAPFAVRNDVHFVVRMVDPPTSRLPFASLDLVTGKPGNLVEETGLLKQHAISHIVCRNSGGEGAYAKIEAARMLGLPVIMIAE
jgi:precorrin-6A/cobalt-precorrin-6A reductase